MRTPSKKIKYTSITVHTFETSVMLLGVSLLMIVITLAMIVYRTGAEQQFLRRYVNFVEAYKGDMPAAKETMRLLSGLESVARVPKKELPVVAIVTDIARLSAMPLFENAANGDRLFIYPTAQKIYIYRPDLDLLVAEGPFSKNMLQLLTSTKKEVPHTQGQSATATPSARMATGEAHLATGSAALPR